METGNSGHYVPGRYLNQNQNKKNSGVRWLWIIVTIAAFLAVINFFKDTGKEEAKTPQNYSNYQNVPSSETGLTRGEIMQKYFPLKVGNSWTYKRTLIDPDNVFSYTEKTTTEAGWDIPKGIRYFTVGRSLFEEKTGISEAVPKLTKRLKLFSNLSLFLYTKNIFNINTYLCLSHMINNKNY